MKNALNNLSQTSSKVQLIQNALLGTFIIGSLLYTNGCVRDNTTSHSITMESPRVSNGTMILPRNGNESVIESDLDSIDGLSKIARALDDYDAPAVSPGMLSSMKEQIQAEQQLAFANSATIAQNRNQPEIVHQKPIDLIRPPANSGLLIPLGRLSSSEIQELLISLSIEYQTKLGYQSVDPQEVNKFPPPPTGVFMGELLTRADDNRVSYIRIGHVSYLSQTPQIWIQGVVIEQPSAKVSRNSDIDSAKEYVDLTTGRIQEMRTDLTQTELQREVIQLSYVETKGALEVLKGLGIQTQDAISGVPAKIGFAQLPLVTIMPTPSDDQIGLLSDENSKTGSFGQTATPTKASKLNSQVNVGRSSQLMVFYHPAHPEQLSLVRSLLDEYIDRPARQVFIEGMVLEISEDGLNELGVEWSFKEGTVDFVLGSLDPTGVTDTITFSKLDSRDVIQDWGTKVRALVRDGKAEILSRPSILTLNNRQATIRVGEDVPIATSQEGVLNNSNKVAFNFKYIPTGILLNIRPRINETGKEVSMLIDTIVSALVPGRDLEIRSQDGDLLASAPTISTRRVQTYARINNTTPFIIGGLVSRDHSVNTDKVPFLGDLPLIGPAFRSERTSTKKTEVIIVLTPYVLPEEHTISRALPRDDEMFDSAGNELFRDAYRIHAEDVFDLRFLAENKRLMFYRELARDLINDNNTLATIYPFSEFADDTIPGEEILVERMIYELVKRTEVDKTLNPDRIIYFEAKEYEGYSVRFLNNVLTRLGDGESPESFFERDTQKAIALTYTYTRDSVDKQYLASEPIPEISLVDCPDRDTWQQLLWELNQPSDDGIDRFTILIHSPKDIDRLARALMLKKIIQLNDGERALTLNNFSVGKILHSPKMGPDKISVVDADVAKYFFHTELYYAAIIKKIEQTLNAFDEAALIPGTPVKLDTKIESSNPKSSITNN